MHVRLVKDRSTHTSLGFAFLQYPSIEEASLVVTNAYNDPVSLDDRYLSVTYAHLNSFVLVYGYSEWISCSYLDSESYLIQVMYWDEQAYTKEYPESPPIDPLLIKMAPVEPDMTETAEASAVEESAETLVKGPVIYKDGVPPSDNNVEASSSTVEEPGPSKQEKEKTPKKAIVKGKASAQFQMWQSRKEELATVEENPTEPLDLSDEALLKVRSERLSHFTEDTSGRNSE